MKFIIIVFSFLFISCSSYFTNINNFKISDKLKAQISKTAIITHKNKPNIVITLLYLNALRESVFFRKEYFFIEIYSSNNDIFLPDFLEFSLFNKKPSWIREVHRDEVDDLLSFNNKWSKGFLLAFEKLPKNNTSIKITLKIPGYENSVFHFNKDFLIAL